MNEDNAFVEEVVPVGNEKKTNWLYEQRRVVGFIDAILAVAALRVDQPSYALVLAAIGLFANIDALLKVLRDFGIPVEIDLTGKFFISPALLKDQAIVSPRERKKYLTPERISYLQTAAKEVSKISLACGGGPIRANTLQIRLVRDQGKWSTATHRPISGTITIELNDMRQETDWLHVVIHEMLHNAEARRLSNITGRNRIGIDWGDHLDLSWLGEGITEETTRNIMHGLGYDLYGGCYADRTAFVRSMCDEMAWREASGRNKLADFDYVQESDKYFLLFQQALYGRGDIGPLFTAIQKYYTDEGGIKVFCDLVNKLSLICKENDDPERVPEYGRIKDRLDMIFAPVHNEEDDYI